MPAQHRLAWVEAIDQERVFLATKDRIACFLRLNLPTDWRERLGAADARSLARLINQDGSPLGTPFDAVMRLAWPAFNPLQATSPGDLLLAREA